MVLRDNSKPAWPSRQSHQRFRSADEVVYRPAIRPMVWRHTVYETYIRTSERPSLRDLNRQVHRHDGFVPIADMYSPTAMEQLYSGRAVIVSDHYVTMHMLAKQCRLSGGKLYVAPEVLFSRFFTVAHSKRLPPGLERRIHAKYVFALALSSITSIMESGPEPQWGGATAMQEWVPLPGPCSRRAARRQARCRQGAPLLTTWRPSYSLLGDHGRPLSLTVFCSSCACARLRAQAPPAGCPAMNRQADRAPHEDKTRGEDRAPPESKK
ncbi:hypothetical protein HPB51_026363 [Rhipicephalus microplus]|uniref:Uncharacterized protein n=1 Tax=Rhipicephalus microplus TaxID=6941 RepID=A0A9J6D381_RHIMP|nr:hypothetical protein HPB51_026363 [Rhipicephalus microplus]